jgi:chromosome partitioning protein
LRLKSFKVGLAEKIFFAVIGANVQLTESAYVHNCTRGGEMKTVVVAINKGGAGKTMLAKSMATAAAEAGFNVLVLDMDTQQNSTRWWRRRQQQQQKQLPLVRFTTENDLADELERAGTAGCDLAIIDTPPGRSSETPAAVEVGDLVLIPCVADDIDSFEGVPKTARLARTTGKRAVGILNFVTPNSLTQEPAARRVFDAIGISMAPVTFHRLAVHRDANSKGLTAQEVDRASRAASEIDAFWEWICAELQLGRRAHVHKNKAAAL